MPNINTIKIFACIFMLLDHIGAYIFPDIIQFRVIGRFAFPLFAYCIVYGYFHTSNLRNYAIRLLSLAAFWQIPHAFFIYMGHFSAFQPINVIYTLLVGLYCCYLIDAGSYKRLQFIIYASLILDFTGFGMQYGTYGIATICACHLFYGETILLIASTCIISLFYVLIGFYPVVQSIAPFAFLIFLIPYSFPVRIPKYGFYLFYPFHILSIFIIVYAFRNSI